MLFLYVAVYVFGDFTDSSLVNCASFFPFVNAFSVSIVHILFFYWSANLSRQFASHRDPSELYCYYSFMYLVRFRLSVYMFVYLSVCRLSRLLLDR